MQEDENQCDDIYSLLKDGLLETGLPFEECDNIINDMPLPRPLNSDYDEEN